MYPMSTYYLCMYFFGGVVLNSVGSKEFYRLKNYSCIISSTEDSIHSSSSCDLNTDTDSNSTPAWHRECSR